VSRASKALGNYQGPCTKSRHPAPKVLPGGSRPKAIQHQKSPRCSRRLAQLGLIDSRYAPASPAPGPGGAILYWHVDDVAAALERLVSMGAKEYEALTHRGEAGFVTASVVDPFGNVVGIMYNPHYLEVLGSIGEA
jgi:hypothetical protein